jgi:hypothetical protein
LVAAAVALAVAHLTAALLSVAVRGGVRRGRDPGSLVGSGP